MASLIGLRFGRLTVVAASERKDHWRCVCDCGGERVAHAGNIKSGRTRSCGCLWVERTTRHGAANTPTYKSWRAMINRCSNAQDPSFHRYGGAGVSVDPRWLDYSEFLADMGERPDGTSIDRVDPFGHYCKENCRWATPRQQARNHRKPAPLVDTPDGPMRVCEAAERSGITANALRARRRLGWPASRLFEPINETLSNRKRDPE